MLNNQHLLIVIGVCFSLGYWAVSVLLKKKGLGRKMPANGGEYLSSEAYYRKVLSVSDAAGEDEIRAAYRSQLAKYHPDNVTHLGNEFFDLASRRTKEIIEAYEFLKRQNGFK